MATAWKALATYTVSGSSTTSLTISSIASGYRDLVLVINGTNSSSANMYLRLNGDSSGNYSNIYFAASGGSGNGGSQGVTGIFFNNYATWSTDQTLFTLNFLDFSATDKYKTVLISADRVGATSERDIYTWQNTAAITSITLNVTSGNLVAGSTINLYGVTSS